MFCLLGIARGNPEGTNAAERSVYPCSICGICRGSLWESTNIAARRIGGVGRAAPPTPLGSGGTPAIFGYFPLLESNKQKASPGTARADNRKTISMGPYRVLPLLPGQKWRKVGLVTKRGNKKEVPRRVARQSLVTFHCWKVTSKSRLTPRPGRTTGKLYPWGPAGGVGGLGHRKGPGLCPGP